MAERRLSLDLLRFVAALSVVAFHFLFRLDAAVVPGAPLFPEIGVGFFHASVGLAVFFAISGYVITGSAVGRTAPRFLVDRAARLWPAFAISATLTAIAMLAFGPPEFQPTAAQWLANLTMLAPMFGQPFLDGAYWSIVYELVFYGWMAVLIATGRFERWLLPVMVGWMAIALANELGPQSGAVRRLFLTDYAPWFAVGVLLRAEERRRDLASRLALALALAGTVVATHLNTLAQAADYGVPADPATAQLANAVGMAIFAAAARLPLAERAGLPAGLCLALGALTYPLYLLHQHIGYATFLAVGDAIDPGLTLTLLVAVLATLSWLINVAIEPPGRRLVRRVGLAIIERIEGPAAPARVQPSRAG